MANQIITNSMPIARAGAITRSGKVTIESFLQSSTLPLLKYGLPFAIDTGVITGIVDTHRAADVKGFLVRPFPQQAAGNEAFDAATPPLYPALLDGLKSGYFAVSLQHGTAAKGGKVYVRLAATSQTRYQGGIEAAAAQAVSAGAVTGTGNPTIGTMSADGTADPGVYVIDFTAATVFRMIGPDGTIYKDGATGVAYTAAGITLTVTAGATPADATTAFAVTVVNTTEAIPGAEFTGAAVGGIAEVAYNV